MTAKENPPPASLGVVATTPPSASSSATVAFASRVPPGVRTLPTTSETAATRSTDGVRFAAAIVTPFRSSALVGSLPIATW